jgi:hypothetical protein
MAKLSSSTDKIKEIKLTSSIEQVIWTNKMAMAGGKAGIDVFTKYVGNNSDIKIEIKDKSGKSGGTVKGKITGNRFWKEIEIPDNLKDELKATVKLSKLGLEMQSDTLTILPPAKISNVKWDKNEVTRGDRLKLTADINGVYDGAEAIIEIYEHDDDGAHDLITSFPALVKNQKINSEWEFQYTEDTNNIPTNEEAENGYKNPEFFFRVTIAGISEDSGLMKFKDFIEINIANEYGKTLSGLKYSLILPNGEKKEGKVSDEGTISEKDLPPGKCKIEFKDVDMKLLYP